MASMLNRNDQNDVKNRNSLGPYQHINIEIHHKNISRMGTSSGSMQGLRIFPFFLPHGFGSNNKLPTSKKLLAGVFDPFERY